MKPIAQEIITEIVGELYDKPVMNNLTRPIFVERLLARLLHGQWLCVGSDWGGWDLENSNSKARVEVKQSAARQSWSDGPKSKGQPTKPIFDIAERTGYYTNGGSEWVTCAGRPADLYIFAWHPGYDPKDAVDHRDPEQWKFYVVAERDLPTGQKSIGLAGIRSLRPPELSWDQVGDEVERLLSSLSPLKGARVPPHET